MKIVILFLFTLGFFFAFGHTQNSSSQNTLFTIYRMDESLCVSNDMPIDIARDYLLDDNDGIHGQIIEQVTERNSYDALYISMYGNEITKDLKSTSWAHELLWNGDIIKEIDRKHGNTIDVHQNEGTMPAPSITLYFDTTQQHPQRQHRAQEQDLGVYAYDVVNKLTYEQNQVVHKRKESCTRRPWKYRHI